MKIAIATPEQVGTDWLPIATDFIHPKDIRARIEALLLREETHIEYQIVTMNRTVLDLVTTPNSKDPSRLSYEDVFVARDTELVPLLSLHDANWLAHFSLGDLLERCEI